MGLSIDSAINSSKLSDESALTRAVPSSASSKGWYDTAENPAIIVTDSLTSVEVAANATVYVLPESR